MKTMKTLTVNIFLVLLGINAYTQCPFKTIGHRGGSSYYYPENTIISLEHGFMEEIYAAEIDVQATSDSVLVLMHDFFVDRTTDGYGAVDELSLSYLKTLDAGSWKGLEFKGAPVPTLAEAMLLAEKYGKKLYLNMKVFVPQLVARTLMETGVSPGLILLDPDDTDKVAVYHALLPDSPLVYFGSFPDPVDKPDFYSFLKDHGVIAIEVPADFIHDAKDDSYVRIREAAHLAGLEFWAYTANDQPYLEYLKEFGIQGLETDRPSEVHRVFCENAFGGFFPEKRITGQWDFNNSLNGTVGSKLVATGDTSVIGQKIQFGTTGSFRLPPIESSVVGIARIPAFDPAHALRFFSNMAPEGLPGGLAIDNTYSLVFDLLKPAGKPGFTALFQTSNNNSDDADLFLSGNQNGIGILEQYHGGFADSTWVRIAAVYNLYQDRLDIYEDGDHAGTVNFNNSKDGRFSINNNWGIQSSNFFADDDGETNPVFISSIQLRNYALIEEEIEMLGKPKAAKISNAIIPGDDSPCPVFAGDIQLSRAGDTVSLTVSAGDRVNYLWEINKGNGWESITGIEFKNPATPRLSILLSPEQLVGYRFRCNASNDCRTVTNEFLFTDLSYDHQWLASPTANFQIFPNPSRGIVIIDCLQSAQGYDFSIYRPDGTEVIRKVSAAGRSQVKLPSGTYLIRVRNKQADEVRKLIILD